VTNTTNFTNIDPIIVAALKFNAFN